MLFSRRHQYPIAPTVLQERFLYEEGLHYMGLVGDAHTQGRPFVMVYMFGSSTLCIIISCERWYFHLPLRRSMLA